MRLDAANYWTNSSVSSLLEFGNPIDEIVRRARSVALDAIEKGWSGPPFDPFVLARNLGIVVHKNSEVHDARISSSNDGRFVLEYNPAKSLKRIRYSICHELAHTLFPDCADKVRNRLVHEKPGGDAWQLEALCNIAASELLMPIGSFTQIAESRPSIEELARGSERFGVSIEAMLLRFVRLTSVPCAVFSASMRHNEKFALEYGLASRSWPVWIRNGLTLPLNTAASHCDAVGFTAKNIENWGAPLGNVRVEYIAMPPHPNSQFPRVAGIAIPQDKFEHETDGIRYVVGDATKPRGLGKCFLVHIVNDKTPRWGAGFAKVIKSKWPSVQAGFVRWAEQETSKFALGNIHRSSVSQDLEIVQLICQHGYGPSTKRRLRYQALHQCLAKLARDAVGAGASVHMPRIGCGEAGGAWSVIGELIDESLCRESVGVTVYDLPKQMLKSERQRSLF